MVAHRPNKMKIKNAVDKVRKAAGLPVFDAPLTKATCEKCGRAYYWRVVPKTCSWPDCKGKLKA